MTVHGSRPNYVAIWIWLIGLTIFSIGLSLVFGTPRLVVVTFFLVATVKAVLVARNYMHLKYERLLIYSIALVPVAFVLILIFALVPDMILSR
jgi:caa(3)-type oxidase subunit IV